MGKKPQGRTVDPVLVVNDASDPIPISGTITSTDQLQDCATTTKASVKGDAGAMSASPCDGGQLISGRDAAAQYHLRMAQAAVVSDETLRHALVKAVCSGIDTSALAGSKVTPVEARSFNNWIAIDPTNLNILGCMSSVWAWDGSALHFVNPSAYAQTSEGATGLVVEAMTFGLDTTQIAGLQARPVEARSAILTPGFSTAIIGLMANARNMGIDGGSTLWESISSEVPGSISGRAAGSIRGLYAASVTVGIDTTGAAVLQPVEARAVSGLNSASTSLISLLTGAALFGRNGGAASLAQIDADAPASVSGVGTGARNAIYANAVCVGIDTTGAAVLRTVEARSTSGWDGSALTLQRLGTASVLYGRNFAGTAIEVILSDLASDISGRAPANIRGIYSNAVVAGTDTTGAAVLRPVEARSVTNLNATPSTSLIGMFSLSSLFIHDAQSQTIIAKELGVREITGGNLCKGVFEARQNGYWSSVQSRRFAVKHNVEGANVTAQATYVATTPTLLLSNNAAAVRAIIRSLYIAVDSATVNPVRVVIKIDSANRLSVAGTAITPQNENSGGGASAITAFNENPTATAEGGGTKRLFEFLLPSGKAASISISFNDALIIGTTGSFLVYIFDDAGSAAPSIIYNEDHEEAA